MSDGYPTCKHCGVLIRKSYSEYNHGWTHEGGDVWCRLRMARPDDEED